MRGCCWSWVFRARPEATCSLLMVRGMLCHISSFLWPHPSSLLMVRHSLVNGHHRVLQKLTPSIACRNLQPRENKASHRINKEHIPAEDCQIAKPEDPVVITHCLSVRSKNACLSRSFCSSSSDHPRRVISSTSFTCLRLFIR